MNVLFALKNENDDYLKWFLSDVSHKDLTHDNVGME